jgi:hypothetical protein
LTYEVPQEVWAKFGNQNRSRSRQVFLSIQVDGS